MTETLSYRQFRNEYGNNVLGLVRKFEGISRTKGRYQSHLRFYMHCKNQDLIPKGIKIKSQMQNAEARKIVEKAEKALLNVRISEVVKKSKILKYREEKAIEDLKKEIPEETVEMLKKINEGREKTECEKSSVRQKIKFQNLKDRVENDNERRNVDREERRRKEREENARQTERGRTDATTNNEVSRSTQK